MNNSSLRILAVVSFIVVLFGGMSVYLALQLKDQQAKVEVLEQELTTAKEELKNCK